MMVFFFSCQRLGRFLLMAGALALGAPAAAQVGVVSLHAFAGGDGGVQNPVGSVLLGKDGRLHGVGNSGGSGAGKGVTWSMKPDGSDLMLLAPASNVLATFNTAYVYGSFGQDADGRIYGASWLGGSTAGAAGMLFRFGSGASLETLVNSRGVYASSLRYAIGNHGIDSAGNVYVIHRSDIGTSAALGVIGKWSADGTSFTKIHEFTGGSGYVNSAALIVGSDGWLYGVNGGQGANAMGTVYKIRPDGSALTYLHDFTSAAGRPGQYYSVTGLTNAASLVEAGDWLYGNTTNGGPNNQGAVYRLRKDGSSFQVLHAFNNTVDKNGMTSAGMMVLAPDGNVYGTTNAGGEHGDGTLWRIVTARADQADGGFESLHAFKSATDGKLPLNLSLGSDGFIYGITQQGGAANLGTVFKVDTGYTPPVSVPEIVLLNATPDSVELDASVTMAWAAVNVDQCTASGAWSGPLATAGQKVVTPAQAGINVFTLHCTGVGGEATKSTTVSVRPYPDAVIDHFTASATVLPLRDGNRVTLDWRASEVTGGCRASSAIDGVASDLWAGAREGTGSEAVAPAVGGTHVFALDCVGKGGNAHAEVSVLVTLPARITTLEAAASTVAPGIATTINWEAADATRCVASGAWAGDRPLAGSEVVQPVQGDNYYSLRCYGEGGDAVRSALVTVAEPVVPVDPDSGNGGGPFAWMLLTPLAGLWRLRRGG